MRQGSRYRIANIVLGAWLAFASVAWEHEPAQKVNGLLVGAAVMIFAVLGWVVHPVFRFGNAMLGGWLAFSVFLLPREHVATGFNNIVVAAAIFALSLTPAEPRSLRRRGV